MFVCVNKKSCGSSNIKIIDKIKFDDVQEFNHTKRKIVYKLKCDDCGKEWEETDEYEVVLDGRKS